MVALEDRKFASVEARIYKKEHNKDTIIMRLVALAAGLKSYKNNNKQKHKDMGKYSVDEMFKKIAEKIVKASYYRIRI